MYPFTFFLSMDARHLGTSLHVVWLKSWFLGRLSFLLYVCAGHVSVMVETPKNVFSEL